MALYRLLPDSGSVLNSSTSEIIPNDPNNKQRIDYNAWIAAGNTPDPVAATPLARSRALGYLKVAQEADTEITKHLEEIGPTGLSCGVLVLLLSEARRAAADGSPTAANYPILDALRADGQYITIAAAATGIIAWWDSRKAAVGAIYAKYWRAFIAIDVAADAAAVTAASTVTWPT